MIPNGRIPFLYVEFDSSKAQQGATLQAYKGLLIGQKIAAGTAAVKVPALISSVDQASKLFGAGSMLHGMAAAWFAQNKVTELWAIPLADKEAGVLGHGSVSFGGLATKAGIVSAYIAGRKVEVAVAATDAAAAIATAFAAAVESDGDLPVSAAVDGSISSKVNLTAKNKGECGNGIDVRINYYSGEVLPDGVTATVTAMTDGAGNPDIQDAIDAMGDEQYHIIAYPYMDASNLTKFEDELADRWGAVRQIDGMAFGAADNTTAGLTTLGNSRNCPHMSITGVYKMPTPSYELAAEIASLVAMYGNEDPARPFKTLGLTWSKAPAPADRFINSERNALLYDGISTVLVDSVGKVRIERLISTYQTNAAGAPDTAYLDVNTVLTMSYLRYDFRSLFATKYPRHKLASDGVKYAPGQPIMTPALGRAEAVAKFGEWEELGLAEDVDQFKRDLVVQRNTQDPTRLDFLLSPNLINQFNVLGAKVGFLL